MISELKIDNGVTEKKKPKKKLRRKFVKPRRAAAAALVTISTTEAEGDVTVTAAGKPPLHDNIGVHITIVCSDIFFCCAINPSLTLTLFCC